MSATVVFHVEVGRTIGGGHLSRCRVIANALHARGIDVAFALSDLSYASAAAPFRVVEPDLVSWKAAVAVIDGYGFGREALEAIRKRSVATALIDDGGTPAFAADLLINPNLYGGDLDYSRSTRGRVIAGPRYALVDRRFSAVGPVPPDGDVLVTFGLSRIAELAMPLAEAIARVTGSVGIRVITPESCVRASESEQLGLVRRIGPGPLHALLEGAALVVCGLGVTYAEAVTAGRRTVGVRLVANQDLAFECVRRARLPAAAEPAAAETVSAIRAAFARPAGAWREAFPELDGDGPDRVAEAVAALIP